MKMTSKVAWMLCTLGACALVGCDDGDGGSGGSGGGTTGTEAASTSTGTSSAGGGDASTGTAGDGGAGQGGGTGGTGGGPDDDAEVGVYGFNFEEVEEGGDYFDQFADGIAPYSFSRHSMTLVNESDAPIALRAFEVTPTDTSLTEEWTVVEAGVSDPTPLDIEGITLGPGEELPFDIYFYPVASGERTSSVRIAYEDDDAFDFTVTGRARDNATFSPDVSTSWENIWNDPGADALIAGSAQSPDGVTFVNANVVQWLDGFSYDIALARIEADGSLGWTKVWNEDYDQSMADPSQNGQTGGSADSIAYADGFVYVVGRRSLAASNSVFQTFALKVDADDGSLVWARAWTRGTAPSPATAAESSQGFALDATLDDRLVIVGQGPGAMTIVAIDKEDGDLVFDRDLDVFDGFVDRAHAIAVDADGNATIGGVGNARPLVARIEGVDGTSPSIAWVHQLDLEGDDNIGNNVNSITLDDATGDAFVAYDRVGATTHFSAVRLDTDGEIVWAKTFNDQNNGDNDTVYVVRKNGDRVYLGGRIAFTPFDTQGGEGFVLALDAADGAFDFGAFYYTGKGAEELVDHRVKGFTFDGDGLVVTSQNTTDDLNFDHYWGYWYQTIDYTLDFPGGDGSERLVDIENLSIIDRTGDASLADVPNGTVHEVDGGDAWVAPQDTVAYTPAREREGAGVETSLLVQGLTLE
jgi:hypothetical protein